ncbi:MAG: ATP phosphoribosyltransferase regulatory subunit, partial [Patescibacteria group bacterium]
MTGKHKKQVSQKNMPAPAAPKGMRDIIGDAFYKYQGFFEKAAEIASYYGFTPIETPILERKEIFEKTIGGGTDIVEKEMYTLRTKGGDILALRPEGTAAIMRAYVEHGMNALPQPVMLYYYGPFFRHERPQRGRFREFFQFGIESLGTKQSIADALTIRVSQIILEECGI